MTELSGAIAEPCREWQGPKNKQGYGIRVSSKEEFGTQYVHRQVMIMALGRRAVGGKIVIHTCDNPTCFRFSHLALGSRAENSADMMSKGRHYKALSKEQDKEVFKLRRELTLKQLADKFGVSTTAIRNAIKREKNGRISN